RFKPEHTATQPKPVEQFKLFSIVDSIRLQIQNQQRLNAFHNLKEIIGQPDWTRRREDIRDFYDGARFHDLVESGIFKKDELSFAFFLSSDGFSV
ncbi:hypothetical protein HDV05_001797, partial [Chytridiales sp. JEL 0842]